MDHILVKLPIPISVNKAYAGTTRRHKSEGYLAWIDHANLIMNQQDQFSITWDSWLRVEYTFDLPIFYENWKKKVQDLANMEKVLSDFLVTRIPGFEDHKIKQMFLEKTDGTTKYVTCKIYEISETTP